MLRRRTALAGAAVFAAMLALGMPARASDIVDGNLVFAKDALATYRFESFADLAFANVNRVAWTMDDQGYDALGLTPLGPNDDAQYLTDAALEGKSALLLRADLAEGVALLDDGVFSANLGETITVSMWGRAFGAEPALELVYEHGTDFVGPGRIRIVAIRTGRETKDGWVEYATGPIDGSVWGVVNGTPLRAIVLTARYATDQGVSLLVDSAFAPSSTTKAKILDPTGYAVVDAVEVRPAGPATVPPSACKPANVESACGARGECLFGHCLDSAFVWGAVPAARDHRSDLAARWAFVAQHLQSDRQSIATAMTSFDGVAASLAKETSPRRYHGELNRLVSELRDSHTTLGGPPSTRSVVYPLVGTYSGPLDACFGLVEDDLGAGGNAFAVFSLGPNPVISETLQVGDVVTAIDGQDPMTWAESVASRGGYQTNDPAADPSNLAFHLGELVGRYATTLSLSRCTIAGGCAPLPDVHVADQVFASVQANGATLGYSGPCSLRFQPSVSMPPPDSGSIDPVVVETVGPITSVQFDGFVTSYDQNDPNPYHLWEDPMTSAFSGGGEVLVDARIGWGGYFTLGKFLFHTLRGTSQPYGMFAMPRGAFDDPDPAWLFDTAFDACPPDAFDPVPDFCHWTGGNTSFTVDAAPVGEGAKVAWVNGNDVSMNDIVPRLLQGRANFRVFGPHPSHGAYGEISQVPPILPTWSHGNIQVLDMRFGATPDDARASTWQSGHGVVPDQVVVQKVSDILMNQDTLLLAAKAWLGP